MINKVHCKCLSNNNIFQKEKKLFINLKLILVKIIKEYHFKNYYKSYCLKIKILRINNYHNSHYQTIKPIVENNLKNHHYKAEYKKQILKIVKLLHQSHFWIFKISIFNKDLSLDHYTKNNMIVLAFLFDHLQVT